MRQKAFALEDLEPHHASIRVSVNEQNEAAHAFYLRMGFRDVERRDTDGEGRPYPLILMEREQPTH